jgi:hypothetical protein
MAVVPLSHARSRLGFNIYQGMPFDGYTAVLGDNGLLNGKEAAEIVERLLQSTGDEVLLNLWPFQTLAITNANVRIAAETSALEMSGAPSSDRTRLAPKSRRMAGQAIRKGATCGRESGPEAVETYYALFCLAATERWHRSSPTIRKEFLQEVVTRGGEDAEIWIVRYQGEPISGGVALYGCREVSLWTTATKPGMEILRPHNLLHMTIMEHAAARGVHWYNLNSSSGLEGVLRFKKALGAGYFPYEIVGRRSLRFRLAKALRYRPSRGVA